MAASTNRHEPPAVLADGPGNADVARVREVGGWVVQLARTLKTCRLYDPDNPTVVRFREGAASDLQALVARYGQVRLEVTSRDLLHDGQPLGAARSREDSLAPTFHRDGIRGITFMPGIAPGEVERFIDRILRVTGPDAGDDDLVTLLWDAEVPSIVVESVPLEGDVDGAGDSGAEESSPLPWPRPAPGATPSADPGAGETGAADTMTRSDDWQVLARAAHLGDAMDELEVGIEREVSRFRAEHEAESGMAVVEMATEILADGLASEANAEDRRELAAFFPRILREAVAQGVWETARTALELLRDCDPSWTAETFFQGFGGGSTLVTRRVVNLLDQEDDEGIRSFLGLAAQFGTPAVEWLMQVLTESQQKRVRMPLSRTIADLVRDNPERIFPWMSDERWYVVRNAVHILGWIGGDEIVGGLGAVTTHPDARVRREVVATLSGASRAITRAIFLSMLSDPESRVLTAVLHALTPDTDPAVTGRLAALLRDEGFAGRGEEEKRAVYFALAGHGDAALPALEDELARGGLFDRGLEPHWQAVALCIGRIGTPAALEVLGRGTRSRRGGVRKACELARRSIEAKRE